MRFRYGAAERAAAVIWLAGGSALATARWWLTPLLLVPLLAVVGTLRRGTDVEDAGVTVRGLVAGRHMPWSTVRELRAAGARRVVAVHTDGRTVALPAVRPADLARLAANRRSAAAGPDTVALGPAAPGPVAPGPVAQ